MLIPYLVLYRLSKRLSRAQGEPSQLKQYLAFAFSNFSQVFILHVTQYGGFRLSSPRQPGHAFLSRIYARQRRQFIPQGAINIVGIAFVFFDLSFVMCESLNKPAWLLPFLARRKGHKNPRAASLCFLCCFIF